MSADIFNAWEVLAASTVATIITGGVAVAWAQGRLTVAQQYWTAGEREFDKAERLAAEVERTRNLPWYWPTGPAIEAETLPEAEVLHVEYPTQELRLVADDPQVAAGLAALADEVGLVQAVGCCTGHGDEPCAPTSGLVPPFCCEDCPDRLPAIAGLPHHDDEDAPSDDTERPYLWALIIAGLAWAPVAFLSGQFKALVAYLRDRFKSNERLAAEFFTPAEVEYAGRRRSDEQSTSEHYSGRRVHPDFVTGVHPIVIPAPREAGDDL